MLGSPPTEPQQKKEKKKPRDLLIRVYFQEWTSPKYRFLLTPKRKDSHRELFEEETGAACKYGETPPQETSHNKETLVMFYPLTKTLDEDLGYVLWGANITVNYSFLLGHLGEARR